MNNSMISAMVSMNGIQQRLDMIADNMANVNTAGYKRKEAAFQDTLNSVMQQSSDFQLGGRATPLGLSMGFGSRMSELSVNFKQGTLKETGKMTDLAIEGNAMFQVLTRDGEIGFTRAGNFSVQPNPEDQAMGYLVTSLGHPVLDEEGELIEVPTGSKLHIDGAGNIIAVDGEVETEVGRIGLVTPLRPDALIQKDSSLFVLPPGVREGIIAATSDLPEEEQATIRQGVLENSNVDLANEMAEMLKVQRAYQLAARALTSSDTMMNLANNLRG
ncbi:flagellar hook-basal body protein [Paenibacillus woosongensis]|uniref:Flagellar hook-basal body protein n=1 Tax=Paenibacillus woosongensis TaxID=307580 RepID=A0AA95I6C2_9BACL|nr:flagellar hook-basal body protein [Paenibacillus woosongensis]WHX48757.1 flagellar hook-basal body protein [Paenibacillus woosongensis]